MSLPRDTLYFGLLNKLKVFSNSINIRRVHNLYFGDQHLSVIKKTPVGRKGLSITNFIVKMKIFFLKTQPLPRRTTSVKIDKLPLPRRHRHGIKKSLPRRDGLLKESAATAPPPRRHGHL